MTLPAGFATSADAGAVHPLHVVDKAGFAAWHDAQPPAVQAWLAAQRFDGVEERRGEHGGATHVTAGELVG